MGIDITKIDGYREDMTAEEKLALLDKYEPPKPDYSGYVKKDHFDKTASELAEAKRKLREYMSEEEKARADREAKLVELETQLQALQKEKSITEYKAQFLALGYDEKLAAETAAALAEGDMAKVLANQKVHLENVKKAAQAEALGNMPKPPAGKGETTITKEQFDKMGYQERLKLFNEQPELYMKFTEG